MSTRRELTKKYKAPLGALQAAKSGGTIVITEIHLAP
jgi:hypothetical protein